jgi:hypothetical protein
MINFWLFLIFISVTGLTYGLLSLPPRSGSGSK